MIVKKNRVIGFLSWSIVIALTVCLFASIALNEMGLRVGRASAYFNDRRYEGLLLPTLPPDGREPLPGTTITIWFLNGPRYFSADTIFAKELSRGHTADGRLAYYISFDEAGFNKYLEYWFTETVAIPQDIRNPWIALRPGLMVLYTDVKIGPDWQRVGLLYELDSSGKQLDFRGFEVGGQVVTTIPGSFLDEKSALLEDMANRALRELTFIDADGTHLTISQIYVGDGVAQALVTEASDN